MKVIE